MVPYLTGLNPIVLQRWTENTSYTVPRTTRVVFLWRPEFRKSFLIYLVWRNQQKFSSLSPSSFSWLCLFSLRFDKQNKGGDLNFFPVCAEAKSIKCLIISLCSLAWWTVFRGFLQDKLKFELPEWPQNKSKFLFPCNPVAHLCLHRRFLKFQP